MPVFVDDITLACKDGAKIDSVVQELSQHFKLRDLGPTTQLLGLEIHRDRSNRCLSISQRQYISNLLQEHGLSDCKPVSTPLNPGTRLSTSMCPQNDAEASEMHQHPYISVVGASCIWQSPQGQISHTLPGFLPDSTLILVWLTGKLPSMHFAI